MVRPVQRCTILLQVNFTTRYVTILTVGLRYGISPWSDWSSSFYDRHVIPRLIFLIIFSLLYWYLGISFMSLKMFNTLACHYFSMACNFITKVTISLPFFDQFKVVLYSVTFKFHTTVCSYLSLYMSTPLLFKLL